MKYMDDINDFSDEALVQQSIIDVIKKTNKSVFNKSKQERELEGMGSTLVLALFQQPHTIHIANVGDSRAYLLRNGSLTLLTEDHSITASMTRDGTITESEAEDHPFKHHLTRSIGTAQKVEAFTDFFYVKPHDKILLCSDGLWDVLSDEEIRDSLKMNCPPEETCKNLINIAKKRKSKDNISSIVLSVSTP
jgi:protein phosphatase